MPELDHLLNALFFVALLLYLIPAAFGLGSSPKAAVPARRHCHARNSYSNCGGGERDLVHSLTPEAMAPFEKLNHDQLTWQWICALVRARVRQSSVGPRVVMYRLGADHSAQR